MSNKIKSSNSKNMKKSSQNATLEAFKEIMEYMVAAFCIVLCVFLPLYLRYGYSNVGDSKFMAYKWIVIVGLGIITAIGDAHLESFGSIETTKETKFELARSLDNTKSLYVNIDNKNIKDKLASDVSKNLKNYKITNTQ